VASRRKYVPSGAACHSPYFTGKFCPTLDPPDARGLTWQNCSWKPPTHDWTGIGVGFKVGMRVPGVATVATVRGQGEKMLVAVHGDTPRGVRVRLEGAPWDEWIVGCADPEAVAAALTSAS
jgi:hypothetical protein